MRAAIYGAMVLLLVLALDRARAAVSAALGGIPVWCAVAVPLAAAVVGFARRALHFGPPRHRGSTNPPCSREASSLARC